ncbi:MAG TPA: RDD family protein [Mycobacterium sp.]|nr:RDD family protein [Mycobacterium sp.]
MSTEPERSQPADAHRAGPAAPWWMRAVALAVDVIPGTAVVIAMALAGSTVPLGSPWWWPCVLIGGLALLLTAGNRMLLPAATGWSVGRAAMGIAVVRPNRSGNADGATAATEVGPWRLLVRDLAHLVDTLSLFVGWLWPLWDPRRRTFADLLVGTEVHRVELRRSPRNPLGSVALVSLVAALLCIAGAVLSYQVVYQREQASDRARTQIGAQGAKIVEEVLSYRPESLQADFERARSLVTDRYREKLVVEQQTVEKKPPVANQYWASSHAVLSAAPHRATMLLFLLGQRGHDDQQRAISATVKVSFVETAAHWLLDDLTVLAKPAATGDGH